MAVEWENGIPILTGESMLSDVPEYTQALAAASIMPVGAMMPYMGTSAPNYWLLCDGASYDATYFDDLAKVNSNFHNDGVFRVPDMRGRAPLGYDTNDISNLDDKLIDRWYLGARIGDGRMFQHTHVAQGPTNVPGNHGGTVTTTYTSGDNQYTQTGRVHYNVEDAGAGGGNNMMPSTVVYFIVYTGKPTLDSNGDMLTECGWKQQIGVASNTTVLEAMLKNPDLSEAERATLTAYLNDDPTPAYSDPAIKENHAK